MKQHVDRAQNGRGTYFILSRRHWQETRGLLIISRRSCAASFLFPFSTSCLVLASLSLSLSLSHSRTLYRVPTHSSARVCTRVRVHRPRCRTHRYLARFINVNKAIIVDEWRGWVSCSYRCRAGLPAFGIDGYEPMFLMLPNGTSSFTVRATPSGSFGFI